MMPPPDGYETMRILKKAGGHNAGIPVIVLTANAIEGAEVTYLSMDSTDTCPSPYSARILKKCS
ncbi:MAG: hypothetical protein K6G43_12105 [Lachnospiraceae bacterium]|nr:hypothetical protein [Lachnospiraceae bacterium]